MREREREREVVAGTRHRVRSLGSGQRGACTQATDVSKAADAVFVMLILSLPTAQRGALTRSIRARARAHARGGMDDSARALVSPFTLQRSIYLLPSPFVLGGILGRQSAFFLRDCFIRGIFAKFLII